MKREKQEALFELVHELVETAVDLGRAQEAHRQAAADEAVLGDELQARAAEFSALVTGEAPPTSAIN